MNRKGEGTMKNKITIYGKGKGKKKVHDVGYRLFLLEQADSLFIEGFDARNVTVDGLETLVVFVEGDESQLTEFIDFVNNPLNRPDKAVVENIIVEDWEGKVREIDKFRQSFNTIQLGKIVKTGLYMCKKQDVLIEKQEETVKEIIDLRSDLKSYLNERFVKIEEDVFQIKKKLCLV